MKDQIPQEKYEAETTQSPEPTVSAAQMITKYMRLYGPNARAAIVAPSRMALEDAIKGRDGLMRLYGDEYTSVEPTRQATHKLGGVITLCSMVDAARGRLVGKAVGFVWYTTPRGAYDTSLDSLARQNAKYILRLEPQDWMEVEQSYGRIWAK